MHVIWNPKPLPFLQAFSHCKHIAKVELLHFLKTCDLLELLKHQCLLCRMMFVADSTALFGILICSSPVVGSPMSYWHSYPPICQIRRAERKKEKWIYVRKSEVIPDHMDQVHTYNCTNAKEK